MKIEVVRAFYWEGQVQPVGATLEVTERQAAELRANGKARPAIPAAPDPAATVEDAPESPGPLTTESAGDLVAGKGRKK